jgi:hypothetical protein
VQPFASSQLRPAEAKSSDGDDCERAEPSMVEMAAMTRLVHSRKERQAPRARVRETRGSAARMESMHSAGSCTRPSSTGDCSGGCDSSSNTAVVGATTISSAGAFVGTGAVSAAHCKAAAEAASRAAEASIQAVEAFVGSCTSSTGGCDASAASPMLCDERLGPLVLLTVMTVGGMSVQVGEFDLGGYGVGVGHCCRSRVPCVCRKLCVRVKRGA